MLLNINLFVCSYCDPLSSLNQSNFPKYVILLPADKCAGGDELIKSELYFVAGEGFICEKSR